jgi:coenzyme F420-0:L-glutamate ligase/coenzyme F420-1:gamma-L-glutamate ligase
MSVTFIPVSGLPEIRPGDDLGAILLDALRPLARKGDLVVVTQKVVSKAEGRLVDLEEIEPSPFADGFARTWDRDPRHIETVLRESQRVVRMGAGGLVISETRHGFVCAHAGVDLSNVDGGRTACLLPLDPDASARALHAALHQGLGYAVPVIISDSFGRPWRAGIVNVAIGLAGMLAMTDYRGTSDEAGYELKASLMATADALAAGSELVTGKSDAVPAVLVRGYAWQPGDGRGTDLIMEPSRNLFP